MDLAGLDAVAAVAALKRGEIKSVELVEACLAHIAETDAEVQAWAHLDPDFALEQARACDEFRQAGYDIGPLHGVPVGVKDIFDTCGLPTENGTIFVRPRAARSGGLSAVHDRMPFRNMGCEQGENGGFSAPSPSGAALTGD